MEACSTTGIPTVNKAQLTYEILVLGCTAGFAAYDTARRRVPNQGLATFCPIVLAAPMLQAFPAYTAGSLLRALGLSLAGAAAGFLPMLLAALLSGDGAGVGGGDIKLAGFLGFALGPVRILAALLTASLLAGLTALFIHKRWKKRRTSRFADRSYVKKNLSLPFVPFLFVGTLAATAAHIFIR